MTESRSQALPSTSHPDPLIGKAVGRYVVQRRLGAGAMGEVYLADDPTLKRPVALKRIAPQLRTDVEYRERFLKEAERASGVTSAHVASIYDVLEQDGEIFLVMEFVEGQTLRSRLAGAVSIEDFLKMALQCTEALVSAHERGIVHCDIKPENIMLTHQGSVKVMDFGVAKRLPRSDQSSTMDSGQSGTPSYMAPEVLLNKSIDGRADLFSLGVVFYEVVTRKHPFLSTSFAGTIAGILREDPRPVRAVNAKVPEPVERIAMRLLQKDPAKRYANAAELLVDLQTVQSQVTTDNLRRRRSTPLLRYFWVPAVAALAVVAGIHYWRSTNKTSAASAMPAAKQLVVLPFLASDSDSSTRAFGLGLTDTLTTKLAQLRGDYALLVVPSSEVRGEGVHTAEQARQVFGVNLVLEGSLAQAGGVVRIKYSLVDASTLRQLGGDVITEQASDPFGVEDKVVESVLGALDVELGGPDRDAVKQRGTHAPAAYDYYLRGIGYLKEAQKPENTNNAIELFQRALEQDPNYALAYAGLGEAFWQNYERTRDTSWVGKAKDACQKAESLGNNLAATHVCLGTVLNGTGEYERAAAEFQRATEIDPADDDAVRDLASAYEMLGKHAEAEAAYRRAITLRPQSWLGYNRLGTFLYNRGQYDDAATAYQHVIQLVPDSYQGYSNLGGVYLALGKYAEAIPKFEYSAKLRPTAFCYSNLATAYFYQKRYADAAKTYEQAVQLEQTEYSEWGNLGEAYYWTPGKRADSAPPFRKAINLAQQQLRVNPKDADVLSSVALYYAMLQEKNPAIRYLAEALALAPQDAGILFTAAKTENALGNSQMAMDYLEKALAGGYSKYYAKDDPMFGNLNRDPRFQKLVGREN